MRTRLPFVVVVVAVVALVAPPAARSAGAAPKGKRFSRGANLCSLLGPGDFAAVGVAGTAATTETNGSGPDEAYCVYKGKSAATGGVELDIFVGGDLVSTFTTVLGETGLFGTSRLALPGTIEGRIVAGGKNKPALVAVRTAKIVFAIGIPSSSKARAALTTLAKTVVRNAAALDESTLT